MSPMLQDTEAQLAAMPPLQRRLVIFLAGAIVVVAGWYGWIEGALEKVEQKERDIAALERKIARNSLRALGRAVEKIKKENLALAERIEHLKAMERVVQRQAERLDFFFFDRGRFYDMFGAILRRSTELGVRIDSVALDEERRVVSDLLEQKQRIRIEGAGLFGPVVRLGWYLESFNALMKMDRFAFRYDEEENEMRFSMELLYFGARR